MDPLKIADDETTLAQLDARIERVVGYLNTFKPEQIDGSETRAIVLKMHAERHFDGQTYLLTVKGDRAALEEFLSTS